MSSPMATQEKERQGIGAPELIGGSMTGAIWGFTLPSLVKDFNVGRIDHAALRTQIENTVLKEMNGQGTYQELVDAAFNRDIAAGFTGMKVAAPSVKLIEDRAWDLREELFQKAASLKAPQIAAIAFSTLAAIGLAMWIVNSKRNRNAPDPHIAANTAQLDSNRVQSPSVEGRRV